MCMLHDLQDTAADYQTLASAGLMSSAGKRASSPTRDAMLLCACILHVGQTLTCRGFPFPFLCPGLPLSTCLACSEGCLRRLPGFCCCSTSRAR